MKSYRHNNTGFLIVTTHLKVDKNAANVHKNPEKYKLHVKSRKATARVENFASKEKKFFKIALACPAFSV
jgi:hypothetical protein